MRFSRLALAAGWVGPLGFILATFVDGATRPGYDPWRDYVSHLSLGPGGGMERVILLSGGACTLAFAIALQPAVRGSRGARWGCSLLAAFGAALAAAGIIVGDPGIGYPPNAPPTTHHSFMGTLHDLAGLVAFATLAAATFVWAHYFADDHGSRPWARYSAGTGVVVIAVAAVVAGITFAHGGTAGDAPVGALQRVAIGAGWSWLALVAIRLAPAARSSHRLPRQEISATHRPRRRLSSRRRSPSRAPAD